MSVGAGLSGCLARCQGMFPRVWWRERARTCALCGVVRVSRSLPGNVPAVLVTRASPDMCSVRGCQGVSLVARECSRGFGDESEPGHVLCAGLSGCLARCQGNVPAVLVTRASQDMCSVRGCQGVSLVARECSRGFGDESEPGHVLCAGLSGCLARCLGMFPRFWWRERAQTCALCGVVRVSRSLPGNVPAVMVTRASPDMCSVRGCQGVSLVAWECSRGFGDESEPGHACALWFGG